jgi:hypothetical protein
MTALRSIEPEPMSEPAFRALEASDHIDGLDESYDRRAPNPEHDDAR